VHRAPLDAGQIVLFVVVPVQVLSVVVTASTTPEGVSSNPFDFSSQPATSRRPTSGRSSPGRP
jgi:hypothetical protein